MHFVSEEGFAAEQIQCELRKLIASSAPCGSRTHLAVALASAERANVSGNVDDVTEQAPLGGSIGTCSSA